MAPKFDDCDVDFFIKFVKIAACIKWDKVHWSAFIQLLLTVECNRAFSKLTVSESTDYNVIKIAVLNPEFYKDKFRSFKKLENDTYTDFAQSIAVMFDR